ncbi:hypothetical protein BGY98DRAFT_932614 [Russula aff. rugulosa BPL654]|nr:hypothetical protein BGY98DRAFT_932614 [Russula aff. rugulosa BPL654]
MSNEKLIRLKEKLSRHGEPASCAGGRENSIALQAPGVFRLGLQVLIKTRLDEVMRVGAFLWESPGRHARVCGSGGWTKRKRASGGGRNEKEKDDCHVRPRALRPEDHDLARVHTNADSKKNMRKMSTHSVMQKSEETQTNLTTINLAKKDARMSNQRPMMTNIAKIRRQRCQPV